MPDISPGPVAVDTMGGDHGPGMVVAGAVAAAREHGVRLILVGHGPTIHDLLAKHGFDRAKQLFIREHGYWLLNEPMYKQQRLSLVARYLQDYSGKFYQGVMKQCELYGVDHRTVFNKTPLMLAAEAGNSALVRELLASGADAELGDSYGRTSWQGALLRALHDKEYAAKLFPMVHELLAPSYISLRIDDRLVKLDAKQGEFLLLHMFFALFHFQMNRTQYALEAPIKASFLAEMIDLLPESVIAAYRKKRTYTSSLLSKNETDSTNPYGRKLFKRKRMGWYVLNPKISVLYKDEWVDIYRLAGLDLIEAIGQESGEPFRAMIAYLRGEGMRTAGEAAMDGEEASADHPGAE